jgi:hypothetical protein
MTGEEEYIRTLEETDRLVGLYMKWLSTQKGGNWVANNLPKYAPMDYVVSKDGKPSFFLEVKFRRHNKGQYQKEKVPITKFTFAYTFSRLKKMKSYLLTLWADSLGVVDLEKYDSFDKVVARYDRGGEYDLYAMYNVDDFVLLKDLYYMFIVPDEDIQVQQGGGV